MDDKLSKANPEFKQLYPSLFRDMWMNLFQETIKNLLLVLVQKHIDIPAKSELDNFNKEVAVKTLNELMPLVPLLATVRNFGIPKSLVFISESGQAIDLLEVKEIDQNEMFNQVLDNMSKLTEKEAGYVAEQFKSKTNR